MGHGNQTECSPWPKLEQPKQGSKEEETWIINPENKYSQVILIQIHSNKYGRRPMLLTEDFQLIHVEGRREMENSHQNITVPSPQARPTAEC